VEEPVILEQVLLLQFYYMTSSRNVILKGLKLLFSLVSCCGKEMSLRSFLDAIGPWLCSQSSFNNSLLNWVMMPEEDSVIWGKGNSWGSCWKGDHERFVQMICMRLAWTFKEYSSKACSCILSFRGFDKRGGCSWFLLRSFGFVFIGACTLEFLMWIKIRTDQNKREKQEFETDVNLILHL